MSKEMTAEKYSESEMFLKSIILLSNTIAMNPSDLATYKSIVAKEAVKEFAEELMEILSGSKLSKDVLASDIVLHTMSTIKHLAKQKGVEI